MNRLVRSCLALAAALGLLAVGACGPDDGAVSTADWPAIQERGTIRMAGRTWTGFETLPSQGLSTEQYRRLAERFAKRHGLAVRWIDAPDMDALFRSVEEGRADVAVWNITVTEARKARVAFSVPLTRSREWVVGVAETGSFGVADHTASVDTLAEYYPEARRVPVPADTDPVGFQALIEDGVIDATIMDEAAARVIVATSEGIDKLRELPVVKEHAWALRRSNPALKEILDDYLRERHLVDERRDEFRDWDAIDAAGRLRMLTINQPTTYYLWRGELLGFEYELVRSFAAANDLELEVVVAADIGTLIDWLDSGRGDLISASLVETDERLEAGLKFTRPYMMIRETFVSADTPIASLADLAGRRVTVNPSTSYAKTLASLRGELGEAGFEVEHVEQPTTAILEAVVAGDVDVSLVDSHRAELEATFEPRLALGLALESEKGLRWAVHADNAELGRRLDLFIREGYRGYDFNVLRNKYFRNTRRMARQREDRITGETLSPYDHIVKPLADEHGFDWRIIVAQMYQESGFDPDRVSFAGAEGLLQVLPRTARELGVDPAKLKEPDTGIATGVTYLAWTRERFPALPLGQQLWFALASYNAGPGHVRDGRRLARRLGLNDSLWFDNVELAMLKLSDPEYASRAAYGYVRGSEVVRYVRDIRDRHRAYVDHFRALEGSGDTPSNDAG